MGQLPITNTAGFYEIRMESIGGFGANLAGKILGEAGVLGMGFNGSNFSSYGSEKKGSPVKAFVRFCAPEAVVRVNSPVIEPHMLVVFVEGMLDYPDTLLGLRPESLLIVNTAATPDQIRDRAKIPHGRVITVDAMKIALEEKTRPNTALLGTIAAASGFIDSEAIKESIRANLGKKYAFLIEPNLKTFDRGSTEWSEKKFEGNGAGPLRASSSTQSIGYMNQPIGGVIVTAGNSIHKDLSVSRMGYIPVLIADKCTSCGECDITCPDYCFDWKREPNKKGREMMFLKKINYIHCKGCLRCIEICKFDALVSRVEYKVDPAALEAGVVTSAELDRLAPAE